MRRIIIGVIALLWLASVAWGHPTLSMNDVMEHKISDKAQYRKHAAPYARYTRTTSKSEPDHAKEISFESLRMLSTGMSKTEVVSRVGSPRHSFRKSRIWVYSGLDKWIVQLTFAGERVIGINWTRP
jgi:hypothetical protein